MTKYTILLEKGKGNYSSYCPDLPGVVAAAETEEETIALMEESIEMHIAGINDETED